jgi:hypothetical protein
VIVLGERTSESLAQMMVDDQWNPDAVRAPWITGHSWALMAM